MFDKIQDYINNYLGERQYAANDTEYSAEHLISSILPYRTYDEQKDLYYNENSVGFILECSHLVGANENTVKVLTNMLVDGAPSNASIQFLNWASPAIDHFFDKWQAPRQDSGAIYAKIAQKRREYFSNSSWQKILPNSPYILRNFTLLISVSIPLDKYNSKLDEQLLDFRSSIQVTLKSITMRSRKLSPQGFLSFLAEILTPHKVTARPERQWNKYDPLNCQIADPSLKLNVTPASLFFSDSDLEMRCYSVVSYPEMWSQNDTAKLIGDYVNDNLRIPCPFLTVLNVHITDEDRESARAGIKSSRATQQSSTGIGRYMPDIHKIERDWRFVVSKIKEGQKLVRTFYQVMLISDKSEMQENDRYIKSLYKSNGWQIASERYIQLQSFLACLPFAMSEGMADDLKSMGRMRTMLSWTCANIAPLQGEWYGFPSPCMMLFGRRGQPLFWDPFKNTEGNYNVAVIGKSGSGKSVFMQELVSSIRGGGGKVIVIDDGKSFMNSCLIQGGRFVEFTFNSGLCINPFSVLNSDTINKDGDYVVDSIQLIDKMVRQMCKFVDHTSDYENSFISEAVMHAWHEYGSDATITNVAQYLTERGDSRAGDLAMMLAPFCKGGKYASFFEGKANVTLDNELMVFELGDLKSRKDLQAIVMMMLMFIVSEAMYHNDRKKNVSLVIDEAWDLLHGKSTGDFIEGIARRARKHQGNLITGTQSMNDYFKNSAAEAAIENTDWVCFLAQKADSIEQLRKYKRISMNASMEQELKSLRMVDHQYSEVLLRFPDGTHTISRLILDPYSIALYSSKGEDYARIQELVDSGKKLEEALEIIADSINPQQQRAA